MKDSNRGKKCIILFADVVGIFYLLNIFIGL